MEGVEAAEVAMGVATVGMATIVTIKSPNVCLNHFKFRDATFHCLDPENCKWT